MINPVSPKIQIDSQENNHHGNIHPLARLPEMLHKASMKRAFPPWTNRNHEATGTYTGKGAKPEKFGNDVHRYRIPATSVIKVSARNCRRMDVTPAYRKLQRTLLQTASPGE